MIFQNFMFKTNEKNMKNEKNWIFWTGEIFVSCLKTPNPGSFSPPHIGFLIYLSISEIDFRDFALYFNRICLPGSGAENLVSRGNYCSIRNTAASSRPTHNTSTFDPQRHLQRAGAAVPTGPVCQGTRCLVFTSLGF